MDAVLYSQLAKRRLQSKKNSKEKVSIQVFAFSAVSPAKVGCCFALLDCRFSIIIKCTQRNVCVLVKKLQNVSPCTVGSVGSVVSANFLDGEAINTKKKKKFSSLA